VQRGEVSCAVKDPPCALSVRGGGARGKLGEVIVAMGCRRSGDDPLTGVRQCGSERVTETCVRSVVALDQ
jgi:hypothetical protein